MFDRTSQLFKIKPYCQYYPNELDSDGSIHFYKLCTTSVLTLKGIQGEFNLNDEYEDKGFEWRRGVEKNLRVFALLKVDVL